VPSAHALGDFHHAFVKHLRSMMCFAKIFGRAW
jgi:hypothetical protein